ncbi:MAG: replicative DNA helicase [Lachnospiraceae bacterium]|nr:replicative DNA helicase [Lachnospiraceae bacterium]
MDENVIRRIQPHNNEAEQAVIGAILMDRDVISEISDRLSRTDFYNAQYGIIYEAMNELYNEGREIDVITLSDRLKTKDVPEEISSLENLSNIVAAVPVSAKAKDYAEIIVDDSILRRLIKLNEDITKECYLSKESVDVILNEAEQNIFRLVQNRNGTGKFKETKDIVVEVLEDIEKAARNQGQITGLSTGFRDLDNLLTGMNGGELILVAARPAMGKTAFVLNIVHYLSVMKKVPTVIFSLEMSRKQLMSRIIAMDAMVDSKALKLGSLNDDEWDKVIESANVLSRAPIYIEADYAVTMSDLRSRCRFHKQNNGVQLIVLDYLQLMSTTKNVESRQQFISDISRSLKNLSIELDVPIIALSQLSRAVDARTEHKPVLSDLRESGAIEQDADVVMFIYRDEYYNPETTTKPQTAEINIAKHRNGEVGSVDLRWIGKYTKFADPEKYYQPPQ